MANTGSSSLATIIFLLFQPALLKVVSQNLVTDDVSVVEGKMAIISCRVKNSHLAILLLNPKRETIYFNLLKGTKDARFKLLSFSDNELTVSLSNVSLSDEGRYICLLLHHTGPPQEAYASITVLVAPKVYVFAGPTALLDGGNESLVATCIAERGRPASVVFWQTKLYGRNYKESQEDRNGISTVHLHYMWNPQSYAQGKLLTCVVRHPALQTEFRIPYKLNVQFSPVVSITGIDNNWYVGQDNVKFTCLAEANPPARLFTWTRVDGVMPEGVEISNDSFSITRPLERNDSGVYRCEVINDIGRRSQNVTLWVQEPPPTTAAPSTTAPPRSETSGPATAADQHRALFISPTLASLPDSSLGTIVGGAVGGVLFLILLLILGGACFMRSRRTFRGDFYTIQYLGPSDMQKEAQLDVLQPHELQEVYGDKTSKGSQDLKPKLGEDIIYPNYTPEL